MAALERGGRKAAAHFTLTIRDVPPARRIVDTQPVAAVAGAVCKSMLVEQTSIEDDFGT